MTAIGSLWEWYQGQTRVKQMYWTGIDGLLTVIQSIVFEVGVIAVQMGFSQKGNGKRKSK